MRTTSYDHTDVTKGLLVQITEVEAEELIKDGTRVIVQVRQREFLEAKNIIDFEQIKKLNSLGVFPMRTFLKEKERP